MVRFIIKIRTPSLSCDIIIYIPIWLDLLLIIFSSCSTLKLDLHSNMVRFIIHSILFFKNPLTRIYIPIWLDLLLLSNVYMELIFRYLHSNMVRFIICIGVICFFEVCIIYIPIWLDLLSVFSL